MTADVTSSSAVAYQPCNTTRYMYLMKKYHYT